VSEAAHWGYVAAAYAAGLIIVAGLVGHAVVQARLQRSRLDRLEREVPARSSRRGGEPSPAGRAPTPASGARP
jgi:hypothetical protein